MKTENVDIIIRNAETNFSSNRVTDALAQFKQALSMLEQIPNTGPTQDFVRRQIEACEHPDAQAREKAMLQKKALLDAEFGNTGSDGGFGGMLMSGIISSFLPKIQKAIEENRPKAIAFFRGELDINFKPIPPDQKPVPRIVIVELAEHPSGDPMLADVIIQVRKAPLVNVQVAVDDQEKDISIETHYSAADFANMIIKGNLEEMMKQK